MTISDDNTRYPLTINKKLKGELEKIAKKEKRSLNNLIIYVLEKYRDENENKQNK